ncbi:MAG TPA: ion channel [Kofleriaceae bacterium]|nr:ion channel [Kofleriaceae bacterium]
MGKPSVQPFFDARGRLLLERRGLPRELGSTLANDAYHFLRTTTWTRITLLFAALFALVNFVFALAYWLTDAVNGATGLADCYWFSVQTLATIGYGVLHPASTIGHLLVTCESFIGIGLTALATGVFFSRFATTSARVLFSTVAVVGESEGKRVLMFRMANARATAIMEARVNVYVSRDEVLADGEKIRKIHDLPLRRNVSPIFALSWVVYHELDASSPLHGLSAEQLANASGTMNIIVTFQGIDDRLASHVHTRWAYNPEDIVFDRRFVDIIKTDPKTGVRYLDFTEFHATEPMHRPRDTAKNAPKAAAT